MILFRFALDLELHWGGTWTSPELWNAGIRDGVVTC